ncbi:MAG: type VI secretion system baseplate subunit TssE, partial [Pseudomonadota bacterium]
AVRGVQQPGEVAADDVAQPARVDHAGIARLLPAPGLVIRRDLSWLLNTTNCEAEHDLSTRPEVARSTVNYGVPDLAGKIESIARAIEVRQTIRKAIEDFEPRIVPGSLEINIVEEIEQERAVITFDIRGELWAQPLPLELYLRTAMDVTTGELHVERQA